jgi:hypothetical protein
MLPKINRKHWPVAALFSAFHGSSIYTRGKPELRQEWKLRKLKHGLSKSDGIPTPATAATFIKGVGQPPALEEWNPNSCRVLSHD